MNPARRIMGWALVRVTGAQPERMLNALAERGISFWEVEAPDAYTFCLKTPARLAKLMPALASAVGCSARVESLHGLPGLWRRLRKRLLLAALLLAVPLLLAGAAARIWQIEITGNVTIPDGQIRSALAECGVDIGERWTELSQDEVRNGVILRIPEIRWMTVTMRGSRAIVIVRERREALTPVDEKTYVRIVADRAGIVTDVRALSGTAAVEPGRAVLPGETIIEGYTTGRFGVQGATHAVGYARARTWYEITAAAPVTISLKERSARAETKCSLIIGKKRFNLFRGSSHCPPGYDKIVDRRTFSWDGVFTLPIAWERTVLTPYTVEEERALELREELDEALMTELARRVEDGEIVETAFSAAERDGVLYVTLRAECLESIGTPVPLTQEELWNIRGRIPNDTEETQP